jgi:cytidylate kinase
VARALGAERIDKEVLVEMARQAGLPVEAITQAEEKLLARPTLVSQDMQALFSKGQGGQGTPLNVAAYVAQMTEAIKTLAEEGNVVFVGRGAQLVLQGHAMALHVHLSAPLAVRAGRIQERRRLETLEAATRQVQQADEQRKNWYRHFFAGADWKNPRYYHLMIDTARVPPDLAVAIIAQAARIAPAAG